MNWRLILRAVLELYRKADFGGDCSIKAGLDPGHCYNWDWRYLKKAHLKASITRPSGRVCGDP